MGIITERAAELIDGRRVGGEIGDALIGLILEGLQDKINQLQSQNEVQRELDKAGADLAISTIKVQRFEEEMQGLEKAKIRVQEEIEKATIPGMKKMLGLRKDLLEKRQVELLKSLGMKADEAKEAIQGEVKPALECEEPKRGPGRPRKK